jgi:predicted ester cyclase
MSAEENKAIILRGVEAEAKGGLQAVLAIYDPTCSFPDLAFYGLPPTLEGFKQFLSSATAAFSDISDTVEVIVAESDRVMVWGTQLSAHTGPWRNIPATNKQVSYRFAACYRLAHGKVIEHRFLSDSLSLLQQIGAIPSSR